MRQRSCVHTAKCRGRWVTPLDRGPLFPKLSKSCSDMASTLFTLTFKCETEGQDGVLVAVGTGAAPVAGHADGCPSTSR